MNPILGKIEKDPIAVILKTGYDRFCSPFGVEGLALEEDGDLHILAIHAAVPGIGQCRNFLKAAKTTYKAVYVWDLLSPVLEAALQRYGFERVQRQEGRSTLDGYKFSVLETP